jgi:hypothetical protein
MTRDTADGFILQSRQFKIGVKGEEGRHPCRYDAKSPLLLAQGKKEQMELKGLKQLHVLPRTFSKVAQPEGYLDEASQVFFCFFGGVQFRLQSGRCFLKETVLSMLLSLSHLAC